MLVSNKHPVIHAQPSALISHTCVFDLQRKCEQYWPAENNEEYGSMVVTLRSCQVHASFTIRCFSLRKVKKVRALDDLIHQPHPSIILQQRMK